MVKAMLSGSKSKRKAEEAYSLSFNDGGDINARPKISLMTSVASVPVPALVCERVPATCKTYLSPTDCAGSGDCKWVPLGPPGSLKGMCVYDWDKCKLPPPPSLQGWTRKGLARIEAPVPPKPKAVCNMTTEVGCDAAKCCQWCGAAFNASAAGFCMPMMGLPIPALTCSKSDSCAAAASQAACDATAVCAWHPFGPPGAQGPGVCTYDPAKCLV